MDLQEELNEHVKRGHKACLQIQGYTRKLLSVEAFIRMYEQEAKQQLKEYVDKIATCLLEFRSDMLFQLDVCKKRKFEQITKLREDYGKQIDTFHRLSLEAEKYLSFHASLRSDTDRNNVLRLIRDIQLLLADKDEKKLEDILHLKFKPAISSDEICTQYFGRIESTANGDVTDPPENKRTTLDTSNTHDTSLAQCDLTQLLSSDIQLMQLLLSEQRNIQTNSYDPTQLDSGQPQQYPGQHQTHIGQSVPWFGQQVPQCYSNIQSVVSPQTGLPFSQLSPEAMLAFGMPTAQYSSQPKCQQYISHTNSQTCTSNTGNQQSNLHSGNPQCFSQSDSHQRTSQLDNHQRTSQSDKHQRTLQLDSHQRTSQPDNHQKTSQPDNQQRTSQPDNHQRTSQPDNHQRTSQPDNHRRTPHLYSQLRISLPGNSQPSPQSVNPLFTSRPSYAYIGEDVFNTYDEEDEPYSDKSNMGTDSSLNTASATHESWDDELEEALQQCCNENEHIEDESRVEGNEVLSAYEIYRHLEPPYTHTTKCSQISDSSSEGSYKTQTEYTDQSQRKMYQDSDVISRTMSPRSLRSANIKLRLPKAVTKNTNNNNIGINLQGLKRSAPNSEESFGGRIMSKQNLFSSASEKPNIPPEVPKTYPEHRKTNTNPNALAKDRNNNIQVECIDSMDKVDRLKLDDNAIVDASSRCKSFRTEAGTTGQGYMFGDENNNYREPDCQFGNENNISKQDFGVTNERGYSGSENVPDVSYSSDRDTKQIERGNNHSPELLGTFLSSLSYGLSYPLGVTTDINGRIIVADSGHDQVKIFDADGYKILTLGRGLRPPLRRPSAVIVNGNNEIFVKDNVCIHKFSSDGRILKHIGKRSLTRPFGLGFTPVKDLITLDLDHKHPTLKHFSQDGSNCSSYLYTPLINAGPRSKCRFMAVSDKTVLVSDLGQSQIYLTNLEGGYIGVFGSFGVGPDQFNEPSGITVDSYGNALIADSRNNRIKVYREHSCYSGVVKLDRTIDRPSGIHRTKDNKLLVINFLLHKIDIYQLREEHNP